MKMNRLPAQKNKPKTNPIPCREIVHFLNHPWFFWNAEKQEDFKI